MRIIGVDFGERRIGIASADDRLRIAIPGKTIEVRGDPVEELARVLEDQNADEVVVGLPLSLTGAEGPQATRIREAVGQLALRIAVPIHFHDERLTTAQASRAPFTGRRGRRDNQDSIAASILLQAYLDGLRPYD